MRIDLARELAACLGIAVRPIIYQTPAEVVEGLTAGACDIAFLVIDPSHAAVVDFSVPYVERDFTYLVPAGSSIRHVADADRPGVRLAVVRTHVSEHALRGLLKRADVVPAEAQAPRSTGCAAARWTSWRPPDRTCSRMPRSCRALACCQTATSPAPPRSQFPGAIRDGSPISASSLKRRRPRGWCSGPSSAPTKPASR
jgi:Bacterial extracellular solute-binding proteins, family 3